MNPYSYNRGIDAAISIHEKNKAELSADPNYYSMYKNTTFDLINTCINKITLMKKTMQATDLDSPFINPQDFNAALDDAAEYHYKIAASMLKDSGLDHWHGLQAEKIKNLKMPVIQKDINTKNVSDNTLDYLKDYIDSEIKSKIHSLSMESHERIIKKLEDDLVEFLASGLKYLKITLTAENVKELSKDKNFLTEAFYLDAKNILVFLETAINNKINKKIQEVLYDCNSIVERMDKPQDIAIYKKAFEFFSESVKSSLS